MSDRLGLHGKPYVAFLGMLEPRKNVAALITGWAAAVADLDDPPALVLGGGGGWSEEVDAAVAAVPPHLRLIRPGYLRFSDLPGFLGGATGGGVPEPGRGVRAAGARGDGVRRAGADHALHLAARGGRRGRRLHRAGRREHPRRAARAARRPGPAGGARRGRARPVAGVHLGGVGRGAPGVLPACGRTDPLRMSAPCNLSVMPREPLEAIVLVGGQGTRLRPLTLSAPKPLLPTAGVPFLAHLLARAAAGGVTHVVLATCYKADMFASCFGDGSAFGLSIDYVQEDVPLDTARRDPQRGGLAARHRRPPTRSSCSTPTSCPGTT